MKHKRSKEEIKVKIYEKFRTKNNETKADNRREIYYKNQSEGY